MALAGVLAGCQGGGYDVGVMDADEWAAESAGAGEDVGDAAVDGELMGPTGNDREAWPVTPVSAERLALDEALAERCTGLPVTVPVLPDPSGPRTAEERTALMLFTTDSADAP